MYKKIIKKSGKKYSYYYHNIKVKGRVKNIFLSDNKKEALVKLNELRNGGANNLSFNKLLKVIPSPDYIKTSSSAIPGPVNISDLRGTFLFLLTIFIGLGLFYYFSGLGITGLVVYSDSNINLEVNNFASKDAQVFVSVNNQEINRSITQFNLDLVNESYYVSNLSLDIISLNFSLDPGTYEFIASLIDNNTELAITSKNITIELENVTDPIEIIQEIIEPIINDTSELLDNVVINNNTLETEELVQNEINLDIVDQEVINEINDKGNVRVIIRKDFDLVTIDDLINEINQNITNNELRFVKKEDNLNIIKSEIENNNLDSADLSTIQNEIKEENPELSVVQLLNQANQLIELLNKSEIIEVEQEIGDIIAVNVDINLLNKISNLPSVNEIILDNEVDLFVQESIDLTKINVVQQLGYTGQGKSVCILDTGINYNVFGLNLDQDIFGYDFVNNDNDPLDDNGHGTSVANVVLNAAPNSRLYIAKVINNNGIGYESDVLAGLQYCINNSVNIISLSIGSSLSNGYCDSNIVANKSNYAVDQGIHVIAATGNDGSSDGIRVPACASNVLRVASSSKQNGISSFSNIYLNDLLAPGQDINTIWLNGEQVAKSGSSYSAPLVSGSIALILENRTLSPSELTSLFRKTGDIIYNDGTRDYERLNLWNALIENITHVPYDYNANQTQVESEEFIILDNKNPDISFTAPTPNNGSTITNDFVEINLSITEANLSTFIFNWNTTNYTIYDSSLFVMFNFNNYTEIGEGTTNTTKVVDVSMYNNTGSCNNMGTSCNYTIGKYGNAIEFDGINDHVAVSDPGTNSKIDITGELTISAWIYKTADTPTNGWDDLVTKADPSDGLPANYWMQIIDQGGTEYLDFFAAQTSGAFNGERRSDGASGTIPPNQWNHVAITYNDAANSIVFYINGVQSAAEAQVFGTNPETISIDENNFSLRIGFTYTGQQFPGLIDEVRIWNRTLSAAEINQTMSSALYKYTNNNWAYYTNQSNLVNGNYTYFGYVQDNSSNSNMTETRTVQKVSPRGIPINFTYPTPDSGTSTTNTSVLINVTFNTASLDTFIFTWNQTNYTIFNNSLVLLLNFDNNTAIGEGTSNTTGVIDVSNFNNTGSCVNMGTSCNWTTNGRWNGALNFDGVNDYVELKTRNAYSGLTEGAIMAWAILRNNPTDYNTIFNSGQFGDWFELGLSPNGFESYLDTPGASTVLQGYTAISNYTTWHHLVYMVNSSGNYMYVDGVMKTQTYTTGGPGNKEFFNNFSSITSTYQIGTSIGFPSETFFGSIDEIRIYNISLSDSYIKQIYTSSLYKYTGTDWDYITNQTGLSPQSYTYLAYVNDSNAQNQTELRTLVISSAVPNSVTNLILNSTNNLQNNHTSDDLQVRFDASDPDLLDTLNYSIQWFTNNITNFTLTNISVNNPGTAVNNLNKNNLTIGNTWKAQVLVCDNTNRCNSFANTSELLILSNYTNPTFSVSINTSNVTANDTTVNITVRIVNLDGGTDFGLMNITNWFEDNKSIMVLNLPFTTNYSATSTQDYSPFNNSIKLINSPERGNFSNCGFGDGTKNNSACYNFNGLSFPETNFQYIDITNQVVTDTLTPRGGFTISVWYKISGFKGAGCVFCGNGYPGFFSSGRRGLGFYNTGTIGQNLTNAFIFTNVSELTINSPRVVLNQWYHAVLILNNSDSDGISQMMYYHNGTFIGNRTVGNLTNYNLSRDFYLGVATEDPTSLLNGSITQAMIFNRTLSEPEINLLYNDGPQIYTLLKSELRSGSTYKAQVYVANATALGAPQNTSEVLISDAGRNTEPIFSSGYPQINSTDGTNQTTKNLRISFVATDVDLSDRTLRYNITIFTNNLSNFTFNDIYYINGIMQVETIQSTNLTKGQTWKAMINLFDNNTNIISNTSELLILNTPPAFQNNPAINSTNDLNQTNKALNVFFTPNETDVNDLANLNYSIMVFTSNLSNFTLYNIATTNGTFTSFLINRNNLTANQTWKAQVWISDGTSNSTLVNTTELLILNLATINISTHSENQVIRPGTIMFNVSEDEGGDWISNVTLFIYNETFQMTGDPNWTLNYTVPNDLTPREIVVIARGYNISDDQSIFVEKEITLKLSRTLGQASVPSVSSFCSNETYVINNSNIDIQVNVDLDTLISTIYTNITSPSGIVNPLTANATYLNNSTFAYIYNYTFFINETGNYTINSVIQDIENNLTNNTNAIYSRTSVSINLTGSNINTIKLLDVCGNNVIISSALGSLITIPNQSKYNLEIERTDLIKIAILNATIPTQNITIFNYTGLTSEVSAPTGQRRIALFQLDHILAYSSANITYNYTSSEFSINEESNINVYRCNSISSCSFSLLTSTLDTTLNTITAKDLTNFSVFTVTEPSTTTVTTTTTASGGAGGSSGGATGSTLDIIQPGNLSIYENDRIITPIILKNTGLGTLNGIFLSAETSSSGVELSLDTTYIPLLLSNQQETSNLIITTNNITDELLEIRVTARVTTPFFQDQVKFFMNLLAGKGEKGQSQDQISFAEGLFNGNPECLELKKLINQAQISFDNGDFAKALSLADSAVQACKNLLSLEGKQVKIPNQAEINDLIILSLELLTFLIITYSLYYYYKRRRLRLNK